MLLIIIGPSGAGKTRLARSLLQKVENAKLVLSLTTRAMRPSDLPGEYQHCAPEWLNMLHDENLLAWQVHYKGHAYGTRLQDLHTALFANTWHIAVLTPHGVTNAHAFAQRLKECPPIRTLYLYATEQQRRNRLFQRGHSAAVIAERMDNSERWDVWAKSRDNITILDANKPPEAVLAQALEEIAHWTAPR